MIHFSTEERWFHMSKEGKIYIKLEICKDNYSNVLTIVTHFDENAPNVFKDNEGYYWIPTVEEKDFLNDAFNFIPARNSPPVPEKFAPPPMTEKKESEPQELKMEHEFESVPRPVPEKEEDEKQSPLPFENKDKEEHVDMHPLERSDKEEVFEVESEKEPKVEEEMPEENKGIIVEADDSAIENALKRHQESAEERSIVEADEQTIIEKVLNQKKKGKWTK